MMVLTVRRVATLLRAPWCSSMLTTFREGWEKQTARCAMFFTSLPGFNESLLYVCLLGVFYTSWALHGNNSGFDVDLDYSTVISNYSADVDGPSILGFWPLNRGAREHTIVRNRQGLLGMNVLHLCEASRHIQVWRSRVGIVSSWVSLIEGLRR